MKNKCYDFRPDVLSMIFTAIFASITGALMFLSMDFQGGLTFVSLTQRKGFLFTPAGFLIVIACIAIVVLALCSIRHQECTAYMMLPIGVAGILFALRFVLVQGDIFLFLELPVSELCIALVRALLGVLSIVLLFLLVSNVVPNKRYLMTVLVVCIAWDFATEGYLSSQLGTGLQNLEDSSHVNIMLSQIAYYFSAIFFTFNIKPVYEENGLIVKKIN